MKICSKCFVEKPLGHFYDRPEGVGKRHSCIECHNKTSYAAAELRKQDRAEKARAASLEKNYGLTVKDYNDILLRQGGRCKICETSQLDLKEPLFVDHNHDTGKVRDLLCNDCNLGLGRFYDNEFRLEAAIEYLKRHEDVLEAKD